MTTAKRVKRQSSKPIIGWLQKKLGAGRVPREPAGERPRAATLPSETSSRHPNSHHVVLNEDEELRMGRSTPPRSSRSSTWSPTNPEADDDASIRPLPPTSPPSPAPSRSSSSYLSDPRTFKSVTASTKPTTLLSIDLGTNGMAHIAQAPPTPTNVSAPFTYAPRFSTSTSNSASVAAATSITFSTLPPTSPPPRSESHLPDRGTVQAPLHTSHHPRYNPRPSSPPQDNASVLTLASSAFAFPGGRMGGWVGDSQSQFALDSNSQQGELDTMLDEAQVENASVRALRPRSSRRGSWESEASGWSAKVAMVRERSLKASSWKAGQQTEVDGTGENTGEDDEVKGMHGPSPLAANGFTIADSLASAAEDEGSTPPAKEIPEEKFPTTHIEARYDHDARATHPSETEQTPTKIPVRQSSGPDDVEEDVTQKAPLKMDGGTLLESLEKARSSTDDAEVATG